MKSVLSGLDDLNLDVVSDDRILRCRATAIYGLAEVAHQLGDDSGRTGITASTPLFREAIGIFQAIFDKDPENETSIQDLVEILAGFGDMLAGAGRWQEARDCFQRALPLSKNLAAVKPNDPGIQGQLLELEVFHAESTNYTGHREQAGALFEQARIHGHRLLEQFPDNDYIRNGYVLLLMEQGDWYVIQKDLAAARNCYLEMKSQTKQLVGQFPKDSEVLMDLSTSLERLGNMSTALGDHEEALKIHFESLSIAKSAGNFAPNNEKVQWDVSFGYQKVADCYLRLGKHAEACEYATQCVELRQRIARRDSKNVRLHAKLVHALKTLATASERKKDFAAAISAHQQISFVSNEFKKNTGKDCFHKASRSAQTHYERLSKTQSE